MSSTLLLVSGNVALSQNSVVFSDPQFSQHWVQVMPVPTRGAGGSGKVTKRSIPGATAGDQYYEVDLSVNASQQGNPSSVAVVMINTDAVINDASQSPQIVNSISYRESTSNLGSGTAAQFSGLAVRQNGRIYVLPNVLAPIAASWMPNAATVMRSTDLWELRTDGSGWLLPASNPDFRSGAKIELGFWRSSDGAIPPPCFMYCLPGGDAGTTASSYGVSGWTVSISTTPLLLTNAMTPNAGTTADPVSTATGEYYEQTTDLSLGGPLPLEFIRYHASFLKQNGTTSALGDNWMHNFDERLVITDADVTAFLFRGHKVHFARSAGGVWQLTSIEQLTYQLAQTAAGYQLLDPSTGRIFNFSTTGALQSIQDRNGNTLAITRSSSSPGPDQVADGLGRSLTFTYSANLLASVRDQTGRTVSFAHAVSELTAVTAVDAKVTRYNYSAQGTLASKTLPAGNTVFTQATDPQGRVIKQTDGRGNSTSVDYGHPGPGAATVTNQDALASQHTYLQNNLIAYIDAAGQTSTLSYDVSNRVSSLVDRLGDKSSFSYDAVSGRIAARTDAQGNTTRYTYTAQTQGTFTFYVLSRIDHPDGTSTSFSYDTKGNVLTVIDVAGKRRSYNYNSRGQVTAISNAAGGVTTFTYNSDATLASQTSPAGDKTTYGYDDKKRLTTVSNPDGSMLSSTYDDRDNVIAAIDELGNTIAFSYNDNNQLAAATDTKGRTSTLSYDPNNNISSYLSPMGGMTGMSLDELNRANVITAPTGETVRFGFDRLNRLTSLADCSNKGIAFTYDKEGVASAIIDGSGGAWATLTDKNGRISRVQSPLGRNFGVVYDKLGRVISRTNPLSQTTSYSRDPRGFLTGLVLPGGVSSSFQRDDLGNVTSVTDAAGNVWKRTNDSQGRRTSAADPLGNVTSYTFDSRNRVAQITMPGGSVTFSYDPAGNLIRRLYSDGLDLNYQFDQGNAPTGANGVTLSYDYLGAVTSSNGLIITRDLSSRVSSVTYGPGLVVTYSYDCRGLLNQITDWLGGVTQLAYDDARRLVSISRPNNVITQYSYDRDSRLVAITENNGSAISSITLSRDAVGKVISADRSAPSLPSPAGGTVQFGYDAANQVSNGTYDGLGRPATLGIRSYTWDLASRLTSYSGADGTASFSYDAYGMRVSRSSGDGGTLNYVLNYGSRIPAVAVTRNGSQNDLRYYIWLPDGPLLYSIEASDSSRHFFHFDEMGSTLFLTDDSGAVTDIYSITPYGEQVDHSGTTDNPFTFLGAYGVMQEGSTGLFYMGFRYYDSATARFLSRDPIQGLDPRALNPYQYAFGNPLLYLDPLGQGARAGRKGSKAEGDFGMFVLGLIDLPRALQAGDRPIAPPLAQALLEFLHGPDPRSETGR